MLSAAAVSVNSGNDFELTWTAPEGNTSFQFQESQDPTFASATSTATLSNFSTLSRSFNKTVVSSMTFYFRIRSVNASGESPWSNVVAVTVIP